MLSGVLSKHWKLSFDRGLGGFLGQRADQIVGDLLQIRGHVGVVEIGSHLPGVSTLAKLDVDRNLTQKFNLVLRGIFLGAALSKDVLLFSIVWADKATRVFDQSDDRNFHFAKHPDGFDRID